MFFEVLPDLEKQLWTNRHRSRLAIFSIRKSKLAFLDMSQLQTFSFAWHR